jgi:predicted acylesterase/phospholipase RssA
MYPHVRVLALLRCSELFASLPDAALALLAAECETRLVPGQGTLFRQGDPSDGMYLVDRGRLRIVDEAAEPARILGHVGRGQHVGELSLLTGNPRSATVQAVRDATLVRIAPETFRRVMEEHPGAALRLAGAVTRMLLGAREPKVPTVSTIAVVPASSGVGPGVAIAALARALGEAFEAIGPTAVVDEARLTGAAFGTSAAPSDEHAAGAALAEAFDRIEAAHTFTLCVADAGDTAWTRHCVRHADVVLEIARARADGLARDAPAVRLETDAERQLLVVRPAGARPSGAAGLLASQVYEAHHHAEEGSEVDLARIARLVAGKAHGVALSGGGSRTVAYVGVLRALAEAGIPIDVVAGTSGGAMLGAMCALGWDYVQMLGAMRTIGRTPLWLDLCPPLLSVMSGRVYERMLRDLFGDAAIEDLPIPFLPVCASLHDGAVVVPGRGPVWRAIRASSALPGVWPPVTYEGHLLVDGGISNNLPVDLVRARCGRGRVVACDVGVDVALDGAALASSSGWGLLLQRLWPFGARRATLGLLDVVVRATCAAGTRHRAGAIAEASIYVEPLSVPGASSIDGLVARGYEAARAALKRGVTVPPAPAESMT